MSERQTWYWCLFGSGALSNEAKAHPVTVRAAACSHRHTRTLKSIPRLQIPEKVKILRTLM